MQKPCFLGPSSRQKRTTSPFIKTRQQAFKLALLFVVSFFLWSGTVIAADAWQNTGKAAKEFLPGNKADNSKPNPESTQKKNTVPQSKANSDNKIRLTGENVVTVFSEVERYLEDSENYGQSMRELRAIRYALNREYDSVTWRNKQQQLTTRTEVLLNKFYWKDQEVLRLLRIAYTEVLMYEPEKHISINDRLRMERGLSDRINLMNYRFVSMWLVRHSRGGEFMPRDLEGFNIVCEQDRTCWQNFASVYRKKLKERREAICNFLKEDTGCERYMTLYKAWLRYISSLVGKEKTPEAARAEAYALLLAYQELDELPLPFIYLDSKEIRSRYFGPDVYDLGL